MNSTNKRAKRNSKHNIRYFVVINDSDPIAEFKTHRKAVSFIKKGINLTQYNLNTESVIKVVKEKYSINTISRHTIKPAQVLMAVELGLE